MSETKTRPNLDHLQAVAEAATEGPWEVVDLVHTRDIRSSPIGVAVVLTDKRAGHRSECLDEDAEHIAAFDPPTALALIEMAREGERLREEVKKLKRIKGIYECKVCGNGLAPRDGALYYYCMEETCSEYSFDIPWEEL